MSRELIIYEELKRLRAETERREPAVLRLPVPTMPYWPEHEERPSDDDHGDDEETASRGVVIIDMNDFSEIQE